MNLLQSLWTAPPSFWLKRPAMLLQTLSINLARQHYGLTFCCDRRAARIAEILGWEFDSSLRCLDKFDSRGMRHIWALGKIQSLLCQSGPAMHIDGDVLLTKPLPLPFCAAPIVAQSIDPPAFYQTPDMIRARHIAEFPEGPAYNTGIMGGGDWRLVTRYAEFAMDAAKRFRNCPLDGGKTSMVIEQASLGCFSDHLPTVLFSDSSTPYDLNEIGYQHVVSGRRTPEVIARAEAALARQFPEAHAAFNRGWASLGGAENIAKEHPLLA